MRFRGSELLACMPMIPHVSMSLGISGLSRSPGERQKERQVALQLLRDEKIFLHVLMPVFAEFCRDFRVGKQKANLIGRAFHGMRQQAGMLMDDLDRYAAHRSAHPRFFFPQRSGTREATA